MPPPSCTESLTTLSSMSRRSLHCVTAVVVVTVCLMVSAVNSGPPSCPRDGPMEWREDPEDCSKFYVCHAGRLFNFNCGLNVWNQELKTCVGKGSYRDECTPEDEDEDGDGDSSEEVEDCENSDTAIYAKDDHCAEYYDCSSVDGSISDDPHLLECRFPMLFNPDSKRCEHYSMVKCGDRMEPKDACEYVDNQCDRGAIYCTPCNVRFPTCKDQKDGLNPWVGREYSDLYVLCQDERALYKGRCQSNNPNMTQIFDPVVRMCVELTEENSYLGVDMFKDDEDDDDDDDNDVDDTKVER